MSDGCQQSLLAVMAEAESRDPWESRYRALEETAVKLRDERDQLRADLDTVRRYFKSTWNIDKIIERGRGS